MSHELLGPNEPCMICEISIGYIHGTDDFLGQNICQGQRRFSEMENSHKALIPMGDWCRLEYP